MTCELKLKFHQFKHKERDEDGRLSIHTILNVLAPSAAAADAIIDRQSRVEL